MAATGRPDFNKETDNGTHSRTHTFTDTHSHSNPGAYPDKHAGAERRLMEYALAFAVLAALAGAVARNVTAAALLGSFAFSSALEWLGVPFNLILWMVIDLVVILFIIRVDMKRRDLAILALFLPIWALYIAMPTWASLGGDILIAIQMLLTFPVRRTWGASRAFITRLRDDNGMKMVRA